MAKATIVCGTADRDGVTSSMCLAAQEELENRGFEVLLLRPSEMDIGHCMDCRRCSGGRCIIDDDMAAVYDAFSDSDIFIIATPIHFSGPSSIAKMVMDRFQPYWYDRTLPHPARCLALMCGGSKEPNFDITEKVVRAFCLTTGMEYGGSLRIAGTDSFAEDIEKEVAAFVDQSM